MVVQMYLIYLTLAEIIFCVSKSFATKQYKKNTVMKSLESKVYLGKIFALGQSSLGK